MADDIHEGNATPTATDDDIKRMDADTPTAQPGAAVHDQGVGNHPTDSTDPAQNRDPKSGGTPVHPSPAADSQEAQGNAEGDEPEGQES